MAVQGKCIKCKTRYVFINDSGREISTREKLNNFNCPVCYNTLKQTSHQSHLITIKINPYHLPNQLNREFKS